MAHGMVTIGTTPEGAIRDALAKECSERAYSMELVGKDAETLRKVVNEGIDSHLTAVVRSRFHWQGHRLAELPLWFNHSASPGGVLFLVSFAKSDGSVIHCSR